MPYKYAEERKQIFRDDGPRHFLNVRDHIFKCLELSGAVLMGNAINVVSGDTWKRMAYVDYMVELGELKEITGADTPGQYRVFVSAK